MKKSKFTEQQIAFALRQAETGTKVKTIIRQLGITEQTFYRWKRKFGALVHESERCRRILRFGDLVHAPIAKDSGRPSSIIRFRILQAINASASCDLG